MKARDVPDPYITLRHELNEAEQVNIGAALLWANSRRRDVLDREFLNELHERMFGDVWRWAGRYRTTEHNIGVDPYRIASEVQQVIDDARYWVEHETYPPRVSRATFSPSNLVDLRFRSFVVLRKCQLDPILLGKLGHMGSVSHE